MGRRRKRTEAERAWEEHWWKARGASLAPGSGCFQTPRYRSLESLDREGAGRAFSLDWSEGLLTMEWRRGS
jgi:hypothetical protein